MSSSPPPTTDHADKKSPAAASVADASLPAVEDLGKETTLSTGDSIETAPSNDNQAATNAEVGFLQGKTFAQKMHTLLAKPNYSSIISWNEAGTTVVIHDVDAFISTVMPVHFQHSQFDSFTRRMRRWGFRVANHRSPSSTSPEQGQSTAMEFSSENFLRDQPELCLLMKDERQAKRKFQFLDRNVREADGVDSNLGPAVGVVHYPSTPASRSVHVKPSSKKRRPITVHYPPSLSNMNIGNNPSQSQLQSELTSTADGRFNAVMNHGYLHNYSQQTSIPSMISPHQQSFHNAMPMMNMMMPPPSQQLNYPTYGYGAPPQAPGLGFGPTPPVFQYPTPDGYQQYPAPDGYQPYLHEQQQQHIMSMMDARASTAASASNALLLSSSSEETPDLDLLPTKTSPTKDRI
eukprot:scaffold637_cov173-Skeletonema_marinoi.AAC.3